MMEYEPESDPTNNEEQVTKYQIDNTKENE
jgi:hypothetical protein